MTVLEEIPMKTSLSALAVIAFLAVYAPTGRGQSTPNTTPAHCAAARTAAGSEYVSLYNRFVEICGDNAPARRGGGGGRGAAPPRDTWYHEPAKVFDNLYFIGTKVHNAWALQTSDGLIMIDSLYGYAARDEQVEGLRKIGVNPAT